MVDKRSKKRKQAKKVSKKSESKKLGRRKSVINGAKIPNLVLAHERLRARILCDGELLSNHIKEVASTLTLDRKAKKTFLELYLPALDPASRVSIRKINDDNIGVFAKRLIYNDTILSELTGSNSGKVTNHINSSISKYKSVMKRILTYKRKNQNITSINNFYLVGPLAFANHSCSTHMNAITVNGKLKNISLVQVIEKNQQITYDYGYKNDYCIDCNNNK